MFVASHVGGLSRHISHVVTSWHGWLSLCSLRIEPCCVIGKDFLHFSKSLQRGQDLFIYRCRSRSDGFERWSKVHLSNRHLYCVPVNQSEQEHFWSNPTQESSVYIRTSSDNACVACEASFSELKHTILPSMWKEARPECHGFPSFPWR